MKAHQDIGSISDPITKAHAVGNDAVDKLAKEGALLHPDISADVVATKCLFNEIKNQALHMIDVLKDVSLSRTEVSGKLKRLPKNTVLPMVAAKQASTAGKYHSFKWTGKCFVCDCCLLRKVSLADKVANSFCPGPPAFGNLLSDNDHLGHSLWSAGVKGGGVILFCTRCFHYAAPHPRKLLSSCPGVPCSSKSSEMFYLLRRRHPVDRSKLFLPMKVG